MVPIYSSKLSVYWACVALSLIRHCCMSVWAGAVPSLPCACGVQLAKYTLLALEQWVAATPAGTTPNSNLNVSFFSKQKQSCAFKVRQGDIMRNEIFISLAVSGASCPALKRMPQYHAIASSHSSVFLTKYHIPAVALTICAAAIDLASSQRYAAHAYAHRSPWLQTTISHRPTALSPFRHATPVHHIAFKPHAFATTVSPSFTCSAPEYAPSPSLCPLAVLCAVALTPCA